MNAIKQTTFHFLSVATGVSVTALHTRLKSRQIYYHSNTIKSLLTDENKQNQLKFYLSMLQLGTTQFQSMYDIIHIDKK